MDNQDFKFQDVSSYDSQASNYNKYIQLLGLPLAKKICSLAQLKADDKVLDVGCGTGLATRQAARAIGRHGEIIGIDLSEGMIAVAKQIVAQPQAVPIRYEVMDAERLNFSNESFDAVISLCAVAHFPGAADALSEMFRVLKPGGRIVISMGYGRPISTIPLAKHYAKQLLRIAMQAIKPYAKAPSDLIKIANRQLPPSAGPLFTEWSSHKPRKRLFEMVGEVGFIELETSWHGNEFIFDSAEDFWDAQISIVTEVRKKFSQASPALKSSLKSQYLSITQETLNRGGSLIYPFGGFFVSAKRSDNN